MRLHKNPSFGSGDAENEILQSSWKLLIIIHWCHSGLQCVCVCVWSMGLTCLIWVFSRISPPVALLQAEMYIAVHVQCPHFLTDFGETWNVCVEGKQRPHFEDSRKYKQWQAIYWRKSRTTWSVLNCWPIPTILLRCVGHEWHKVHVCRLESPSFGSWYTGENVRGSSFKESLTTCPVSTKMTACVGDVVVSAVGICHNIATLGAQKLIK